jgi:hypothetical protein
MQVNVERIVQAYLKKAKAHCLRLRPTPHSGEVRVYFDYEEGQPTCQIVGIQGNDQKAFPREGESFDAIKRWVHMNPKAQVYHASLGWLSRPDMNAWQHLRAYFSGSEE